MDVSEVDAAMIGTAQIAGGPSIGSGAGSLTATLEFQEQPTIRYQPLLGWPLIQQVTTPIGIDSIARLFDSDWRIGAVLQFSVDRLAPDYDEYGAALNAIISLDDAGALIFSTARAEGPEGAKSTQPARVVRPRAGATINISQKEREEPDNAVAIYFRPHQPASAEVCSLWHRLESIYSGFTRKAEPAGRSRPASGCIRSSDAIYLVTSGGSSGPKEPLLLPFFRTRSALGILQRASTTPRPLIAFVTPDEFCRIVAATWNLTGTRVKFCASYRPSWDRPAAEKPCEDERKWYTLLPRPQEREAQKDLHPYESEEDLPGAIGHAFLQASAIVDRQIRAVDRQIRAAEARLNSGVRTLSDAEPLPRAELCLYTTDVRGAVADDQFLENEQRLRRLRRYVLIIKSAAPPPADAYVRTNYNGVYHWIDGDDAISQTNFALIAQFLTMQALPSEIPPLTPTISVGPKKD